MAWESFNKFKKIGTIQVADAREGLNGLKNYNVYTYKPAMAFETETRYRVSF
jgi:hypothetical protein